MGWKKVLKSFRDSKQSKRFRHWIVLTYHEIKNKKSTHYFEFHKIFELENAVQSGRYLDDGGNEFNLSPPQLKQKKQELKQLKQDFMDNLTELFQLDYQRDTPLISQDDRNEYLEKADPANKKCLIEEDVLSILNRVFEMRFKLQDLIEGTYGKPKDGFEIDEWNKAYASANAFLSKERKKLKHFLNAFWTDEVYQQYTNNGWSDSQLFDKFISIAMEHGQFPLFCDLEMFGGDGFYKPLDIEHYVTLLSRRTSAIAKEMIRRGDEVKQIEAKGFDLQLPAVNGNWDQIQPLEPLRFPLPPPKEKEVFPCPLCNGERKFENPESLKRHLRYKHKMK